MMKKLSTNVILCCILAISLLNSVLLIKSNGLSNTRKDKIDLSNLSDGELVYSVLLDLNSERTNLGQFDTHYLINDERLYSENNFMDRYFESQENRDACPYNEETLDRIIELYNLGKFSEFYSLSSNDRMQWIANNMSLDHGVNNSNNSNSLQDVAQSVAEFIQNNGQTSLEQYTYNKLFEGTTNKAITEIGKDAGSIVDNEVNYIQNTVETETAEELDSEQLWDEFFAETDRDKKVQIIIKLRKCNVNTSIAYDWYIKQLSSEAIQWMKDNQNTSYGKLQKTSQEFKDSYKQELKDLVLIRDGYSTGYNYTYRVEDIFRSINNFVECVGRQEDTNTFINECIWKLESFGYICNY